MYFKLGKVCSRCPFATECWEEGSDYCYRDKELIIKTEVKDSEGTNSMATLGNIDS